MSQKNVVLVSTALLEWERVARLSHLTWTYILINKKGTNLLWHLQHHQADQILMLLKMLSKLYVNTLYHETCLVTTQQSRAGFLSLLHWGHIQKMTVQIQAHSSKPCCCWPTVIDHITIKLKQCNIWWYNQLTLSCRHSYFNESVMFTNLKKIKIILWHWIVDTHFKWTKICLS